MPISPRQYQAAIELSTNTAIKSGLPPGPIIAVLESVKLEVYIRSREANKLVTPPHFDEIPPDLRGPEDGHSN
jgi:hypothetical protein